VFLILLIAWVMALGGCGESQTRTKATGHSMAKTTTTHQPTVDGGWVEKTITIRDSEDNSDSETKTSADDATKAFIGTVGGPLIGAVTGTPGLPWDKILGGAALTAATGWAALKQGQAAERQKQVDYHKADADEAYKKLDAA
jgi:hypothetical protein